MPLTRSWTPQELLVALNIYAKLPFGQFDKGNPVIIDVAQKLGRTPSSVGMKLCNFASLDPALKARGRKGLEGASKLDREVWAEFQAQPEIVAAKSEEAIRELFNVKEGAQFDLVKGVGVQITPKKVPLPPTGETTRETTVMVRRGQQFFRQMVLNAFESQCCITGIAIRELLVASHIKPWNGFPESRLDIQNGLCLSRIHDAAFDAGMISFDPNYRLIVSPKLLKSQNPTIQHSFQTFVGQPIRLPHSSLKPKLEFLQFHRETIFQA